MKAVKWFCLMMLTFTAACSGGDGEALNDFVLDPGLSIGDQAEIINPLVASYPLGIISSDEGNLTLVTNRLVIDPIDDAGLEALLEKYGAAVVEDANIEVPEDTILDQDGAHSGGTTYQVLEINPTRGVDGKYAKYASSQGVALPITISNEDTKGLLNIVGQMFLEDSGKFRDLQIVPYAFEQPTSLLPNISVGIEEWATCGCLWRDSNGELKTREGVLGIVSRERLPYIIRC